MRNYIKYHLSFRYRFSSLLLLLLIYLANTFCLFAADKERKTQSLVEKKKEKIVRLYERKRYAKANAQIELLLPLLKNRADRSQFEFYQAYGSFYTKKYLVGSNQFHLFVKQYPTAPQAEEALFMKGYSLACENVSIHLDQTITYDAIGYLEDYLAIYQTGIYRDKASEALQSLRERLMQKRFQAAALYAQLRYYDAAIVALKNFHQSYPDASCKEAVLRLIIKCYEELALQALDPEKKQAVILDSYPFAQALEAYLNDKKDNALAKRQQKF